MNPFLSSKKMKKADIGRHASGILEKSRRSPGMAGVVLLRVLALAQVCGLSEVSLADLIDMMAHACLYEQLARQYIAAVLGVKHTDITRFGYRLPNGQFLGSLDYSEPRLASPNGAIEVGQIRQGNPHLTYPLPIDQLQDVRIQVSSKIQVTENEPVFMPPGIATALFYRPVNNRKRSIGKDLTAGVGKEVFHGLMPNFVSSKVEGSRQKALKQDIHGNALYLSREAEWVTLKVYRSTTDGRLYARITEAGDFVWQILPQGLFGTPCNCDKPDPKKRIVKREINGIPITDVFDQSLFRQTNTYVGYESCQFHWVAGDLPMIISKASRVVMNTYVQVHGQCLFCALNMAMGLGCSIVIAKGL